jgi:hypothetical protein
MENNLKVRIYAEGALGAFSVNTNGIAGWDQHS